jgi:hypothetical protein
MGNGGYDMAFCCTGVACVSKRERKKRVLANRVAEQMIVLLFAVVPTRARDHLFGPRSRNPEWGTRESAAGAKGAPDQDLRREWEWE